MNAESLRDEMIVPRTPSPLPLEQKGVTDLKPEETRELLRRQKVCSRDQRATLSKITNGTHSPSQPNNVKPETHSPRVKRERPESVEPPSRSYKIARNEEGIEVLDLADSDDEKNPAAKGQTPSTEPNRWGPWRSAANSSGIINLEDFDPEN
jgi:hypothetical protein